jgi:hypothetical protein
MGKGTYHGGTTKIGLGAEGTYWGSSDEAQQQKVRSRPRRTARERPPTASELVQAQQQDEVEEQKLLRSFISMCVAAYAAGKLTASEPAAPKRLHKRVLGAGGNVKWLEANRRYQEIFHRAYCSRLNKEIPFEKVWGPRGTAR